MTTGEKIRKLRGDMTQEQLAAKAKVTHATITRLECGKHEGTVKTLRKLAKALGVRPEELIGGLT